MTLKSCFAKVGHKLCVPKASKGARRLHLEGKLVQKLPKYPSSDLTHFQDTLFSDLMGRYYPFSNKFQNVMMCLACTMLHILIRTEDAPHLYCTSLLVLQILARTVCM